MDEMNDQQIYEDSLFMEEGSLKNNVYFIMADEIKFWPDGQGKLSKAHIQSAKNNGAKYIYINDLMSGTLYHTTVDRAISGGNDEFAVFLKYNMDKLEERDLLKHRKI